MVKVNFVKVRERKLFYGLLKFLANCNVQSSGESSNISPNSRGNEKYRFLRLIMQMKIEEKRIQGLRKTVWLTNLKKRLGESSCLCFVHQKSKSR